MSSYLFVHFTSGPLGDKEHIWYAISHDGINWTDLGGKKPIISSDLGTRGIRDPFLIYDEKNNKYIIIATDLLTTRGTWDAFSNRGSRSILVWESTDLIHWTHNRLCEVGVENAGCVWAPEAIYCKEKDMWFVFWASNVKENGDIEPKQRIYGAFTSDFRQFTPTFKYIDAETAIIDTNIIWDNGYYYRFSKDETNKLIIIERSSELISDSYEPVYSEVFEKFYGLEGPEAYYLDDLKKWCLIADQYHKNKGYTPFLCDDLSTGEFHQLHNDQYNMGKRKKRHGGVLKISDEMADRLIEHFGIDK